MTYDWMAMLVALGLIVALSKLGYYLAFKVPALAKARDYNREQDKIKLAMPKYRPVVKQTQMAGLSANVAFFVLAVPFFATLEPQPILPSLLQFVGILMVYDFFYYLMHRFLFHGQGPLRKIHALHHQARTPTYIDAHYVHPLETVMGLSMFLLITTACGVLVGPLHVVTLAVTFVFYTQINTINHTHTQIPGKRYALLNYITAKHHVHHENMHKGNYASITLLFDKMFGTLD